MPLEIPRPNHPTNPALSSELAGDSPRRAGAALYDVPAEANELQAEALGLELIEVRRLPPYCRDPLW
jgi:hypothetical protein